MARRAARSPPGRKTTSRCFALAEIREPTRASDCLLRGRPADDPNLMGTPGSGHEAQRGVSRGQRDLSGAPRLKSEANCADRG